MPLLTPETPGAYVPNLLKMALALIKQFIDQIGYVGTPAIAIIQKKII
jgi:hypothetical protein